MNLNTKFILATLTAAATIVTGIAEIVKRISDEKQLKE